MNEDIFAEQTPNGFQPGGRQSGQFITLLDGQNQPRQINLASFQKSVVTFGRAWGNDIPDIAMTSGIVSRNHGRFVLTNGQWSIEDSQSTNGILCADAYIRRRLLSEGDILRIDSRTQERQDGVIIIVSSNFSEDTWRAFPLSKQRIIIGRDPRCDLPLHHVGVGRVHAVMRYNGKFWAIEPEAGQSLLINGAAVQGAKQLHEKDVIAIANTRLIYSCGALYYCSYNHGISVDARGVVIRRGKGKKSFVTSDHVSMSIRPGELISIIGGSGAGKSTILNALCGYLPPSEGHVYINGVDLYRNLDALKNLFGYVPQSDIVYDNLTLYDMLKYTAKLRLPKDMDESEQEAAIDKAIAMVDLKEKRNSMIKALSGGQRKRASIAVELLPDPKLLFLDEPASGLDPGTERSLMQSLREMADAGKTIILVTHSTLQLGLCDKVAFMGRGGRLCFFGSLQNALSFFQVKDVVDIYAKINDQPVEWRNRYMSTVPESAEKKQAAQAVTKVKKNRWSQLLVLCGRYAKLVLNDRQRLLLLILQAPALAALIALVADGEQFKQYEMTKSLLFSLSCSGFWIGMLNAIQEICKERNILKREYMTGLSLSAYVASKMLVLGLLCLLQSGLVAAVFSAMVGAPEEGLMLPPVAEFFVSTWLTSISAAAMGLFVSALFTNPDRAMTVAPLLLMPQMLFSGLLFELSGATEVVSWFAICRWSMEGYGTTANLNSLPYALEQQGFPMKHEPEQFFEMTNEHILTAWALMAGFTVLFLVLARLVLPRIRNDSN